jgi:hypothetical protein
MRQSRRADDPNSMRQTLHEMIPLVRWVYVGPGPARRGQLSSWLVCGLPSGVAQADENTSSDKEALLAPIWP